tara:strand:+ start:372 stop:740 length:369 start_codon:yes stop_codon:yes gene_type:complete
MGATKNTGETKDYVILIIFANDKKILDLTTKSNIKCYEWSLKKRLSNLDDKYRPTNKIVKFVKDATDDYSNIKISTLKILQNVSYTDATLELENVSIKTEVPTVHNLNSNNDALNLIKSKLA